MAVLADIAFVFDIDDTLYDQLSPFQEAYTAVFGEDYPTLPLEQLYARSRVHSDVVFEASQRGEMSMEAMYIYRIQHAFADFDVAITDEQALDFQAVYAQAQQYIQMSGIMRDLLSELKKRKMAMGVITNGPSAHQWRKVERLGLLEFIPRENIIISGDTGMAKPDSRIFQLTKKKLHCEKTVYIGDSYKNDIEGAKAAGWQAVWLNRRHHSMPSESSVKPDVCVDSEQALYTLLLGIKPCETLEIANG